VAAVWCSKLFFGAFYNFVCVSAFSTSTILTFTILTCIIAFIYSFVHLFAHTHKQKQENESSN